MVRPLSFVALLAPLLYPVYLRAQTPPDLGGMVERLDRLERENHAMADEIQALRAELTAARAPKTAPGAETPAKMPMRRPEVRPRRPRFRWTRRSTFRDSALRNRRKPKWKPRSASPSA